MLLRPWRREVHHRLETEQEGLSEVAVQAGGKDRHLLEALDSLQQVSHLLVGIAVVGIFRFRALAEQGVGIIEEHY